MVRQALLAVACGAALSQWQVARAVGGSVLPAAPWQPGPQRYSVNVPGESGPTLSLYPQQGIVGVVTGRYLEERLLDPNDGGKKWYFVELYDHMCPHCWYAVPIVTSVTGAFKGVDSFEVATLNCHIRSNAEACFLLEMISGARDYPTFMLCPPGNGYSTSTKHLSPRAQKLFGSLKGRQLKTMKSLLRCRFRFVDPSVSKGHADPYLSARDVTDWVTKQSDLQVSNPEELTQGADFADATVPDPGSPPGRPGWLQDDQNGAPGVPAFVPGQRWYDALRGFIHLLQQNYRVDKHPHVLSCTLFLAKAFPVKRKELTELAQNIKKAGPQETPDKFLKLLSDWANDNFLPDPANKSQDENHVKYMTCDGSTCAMWSLLHVTVTAVSVRGITQAPLLGDGGEDDHQLFGVEDAVNFVRTFVDTFLSCRTCKQNFLKDFDGCSKGRCEKNHYRELVLWLWRKHNAVSLDVAVRHHAQVDRRWPMFQDCPVCWRRKLVVPDEVPHSGPGESARRLAVKYTQEQLDAPFDTNHVFWHNVRTYVGLSRVRLELSDLSNHERDEMKAVVDQDRHRETQAAKHRPEEHKGFVEPPPGQEYGLAGSHPGVVAGVLIILGIGGLAAAYFCGTRLTQGPCRDLSGVRERRQPDLRAHPELADYDDDQSLTSCDTESFKGDPAAE